MGCQRKSSSVDAAGLRCALIANPSMILFWAGVLHYYSPCSVGVAIFVRGVRYC